MNETEARDLAGKLLDGVEELLDEKNITIPDDEREGNPEEARLYGIEYYTLEDNFVALIMETKNKCQQ